MSKTESDLDAALQDIDRAIGLAPSSGPRSMEAGFFHAIRADILKRLERHSEAIAAANTALAINPSDASALATLAVSSAFLGDFESADKALVQLQKINPSLFQPTNALVQGIKARPDWRPK